MAMPPYAYMEAQREADLHLQLRVEERGTLEEEAGEVRIAGEVVRIFHGRGIRTGERIDFPIKTHRPSAEPMPDAGGWVTEEDLRALEYLEVYLDRVGEDLRISAEGSLHFRLPGPTRRPSKPRPGWIALRRARKGR
jgi:hypothetical protein